MKPTEKAKELFNRYYEMAESIEWTDNETKVKAEKFNDELGTDVLKYWNELAKENALIAVNEIVKSNPHSNPLNTLGFSTMAYWIEVEYEIKKL
jgi:hypothetical protein